jgi:prepilin-type N-terminal cleavage/methylation domain-containing protein
MKGFSLIELLVSMTVVSILMSAAFAILRPQDYFAKTRDSRRIADLKVVQTALEQYYANNNGYPASGAIPFGSAWSIGSPAVTYLRMAPSDPSGSPQYCYSYTSPNYEVCARMEKSSGTAPVYGCSAATYNYCLTNPF